MTAPAVVMSGFAPFDRFDPNSSIEMLRPLDGGEVGGHAVSIVELPVVFGRCADVLLERVHMVEPRLILAFGLADSPHVRPERRAVNEMVARIPDNEGNEPKDEPIEPGGPAEYPTTLPLELIRGRLEARGIESGLSDSAGKFVCNDLFYRLMHWAAGRDDAPPCGFIHVPPLEGSGGENGWEMDKLARTAEVILLACLDGPGTPP